jgi:hypothetical protein
MRFILLMFASFAVLLSACGGDDNSGASARFTSADEALRAAQNALSRGGGYRLRVQQSNLVLPRWGGSDGGTVSVNHDGSEASARLQRTGESGAEYDLRLVDGQTFFKRSTCDQTFRLPGGGPDVLQPYLLAKTNALARAQNARLENGRLLARIEGLGDVSIELDVTARPREIKGTMNNQPLTWTFDAWGDDVDVSKPANVSGDRGPGGIPC